MPLKTPFGNSALAERRPPCLRRQKGGALVHVVAVMAAHPFPLHPMRLLRRKNALPQVDVGDRVPGGILPTLPHPTRRPPRDPVPEVLAVGVNDDMARASQ